MCVSPPHRGQAFSSSSQEHQEPDEGWAKGGELERTPHTPMPSPPALLSPVLCKEDKQVPRDPGPRSNRS